MYTLIPGDIIMTGTPAGVSPVKPGDVLHAYVAGVGRERHPHRARLRLKQPVPDRLQRLLASKRSESPCPSREKPY